MKTGWSVRILVWGFGSAVLWGAPTALAAQRGPAVGVAARCEDDAPGETLREPGASKLQNFCVDRPSYFDLPGLGDFAGASMRLAAPDVGTFTTNTGFSDSGQELLGQTLPFGVLGTARNPAAYSWQNFEIQFVAAAARGDWLRNKEIQPSLQNVRGGGWTVIANVRRLGGRHQWAGHDGSAGLLHSGVQAKTGAGCLDHGGGYPGYPDGFPLLASSDCPQTWGTAGWQGRRPVGTIENWVEYFRAVGPQNFSFDFWRVPPEFKSGKPFIGDFQVFGVMSDHGAEYRARYGAVIPGQTGDPELDGYPIGLDVYFNAYSFKVPSVSRGFIWEGLIVNNSQEVYGVPLDYDSLYFGLMIRPLRTGSGIGGGRRANPHAIPAMGAVVHNELGRTPNCDGALPVPQSIDCSNPRSRTPGFSGGAEGHIIFKSPIGDLRNKHFSDPTSPFYAPNHPLAGDTITFNRMSMCDYRCTIFQFQAGDARRGFGLIAAQPLHALDGRDPRTDMTLFDNFMLFHSWTDPETTFCDAANDPRGPGCFAWIVPGALGKGRPWRYTNRPPGTPEGPDTLFIDNCRPPTDPHPAANECTALWADTLPNKRLNWTQNVIYPIVGPFPLAAGDTTAFVVATFAAPDSAGLMAALHGFYNFYVYDFFLGPGQPAPVKIVSVATTPGSRNLGETQVTLFLDDSPERWRDPFALKILNEMRDPAPGTFFDRILKADPTAPDRLEQLINRNNVSRLLIFKSCTGGATFTSSTRADCPDSPARDELGKSLGFGWQAYAELLPKDGKFPTFWIDRAVTGGQEYLYSIVSETEGIFLSTKYLATLPGGPTEVRDTVLEIVPPGRTQLLTSTDEPNVVSVYVPASRQAGSEPPKVELVSQSGPVIFGSDQLDVVFLNEKTEKRGRWRLLFGARATITEYSRSGSIDSTRVAIDIDVQALMPDGSVKNLPAGTRVLRSTSPGGVVIGAPNALTSATTQAGILTRTITIPSKVGVLVKAETGAPVFVSSVLTGESFTPQQVFNHPDFADFVIDAKDDPGGWSGAEPDVWTMKGDTLRSFSFPSIEWLEKLSTPTGELFHRLIVRWADRVFPDPLPRLDLRNPETTRSQLLAAVRARKSAVSTATGAEVVNAINSATGMDITDADLAAVSLPFRIIDASTGKEVRIAMLKRSKFQSVLLGSGIDTISLQVPDDVWWPGEPLILLEQVPLARTDASGNLVIQGGNPVFDDHLRVTWTEAVIGCDTPQRVSCNPISGPGRAGLPGYVEVRPEGDKNFPSGWELLVDYHAAFTSQSGFEFETKAAVLGERLSTLPQGALERVKVVPNPYIGASNYEFAQGDLRRLMFTNLPPQGVIRIYTASGQFVQELRWTPELLSGNGDLYYDMQTREGNRIASGLYIYVIEAMGQKALKKFIVIR